MTEKELLYVEDAVNHELYMLETCKEVVDCLTDESLVKIVKKMEKKHKSMLDMLMEMFVRR